jgi:hypothetical protein
VKRRVEIVEVVTRQFAQIETLEKARRWLIQAGIDPSHIEMHTRGTLRLTVAVKGGESAEVERVIDAAESSDPAGELSFWDLAKHHVYPQPVEPGVPRASPARSESFLVGWRPLDAETEVSQASTDVDLQKAYRDDRE